MTAPPSVSDLLAARGPAPRHEHLSSKACMDLDTHYVASNYDPLPCVFARAAGVFVWDPEGRRHYDFISGYSALNQGHCHPRLVRAMTEQASRLTLSSRAFFSDQLGRYARRLTTLLGYERMLPMNTGAEAVETAIKLCRRWAYDVKHVPADQALILVFEHNFHGRTTAIVSFSSDEDSRRGFGPFPPGFVRVPYGDLDAVRAVFARDAPRLAGVLVEPIQGEGGIVLPPAGFLAGLRALCTEHRTLLITDEIQTGLGRTGKMLCSAWDGVRGDIVLLGKALSGGMLPVSAVLADAAIMDVFSPGSHGSTFGGSPLACAVAHEALDILVDERLPERAATLGVQLGAFLERLVARHPAILEGTRGRGLFWALLIRRDAPHSGKAIAKHLIRAGVLCKPTHTCILRLAPPLIISEAQLDEACGIIDTVLGSLTTPPTQGVAA